MGELRAAAVTHVHFIVPEWIDDPARPSGGNTYDRRVCRGLAALGWAVHEHAVLREAGPAALARAIERIPDGAVVLLDGLIASPAPEALVPEAGRLRQVQQHDLPEPAGVRHDRLGCGQQPVDQHHGAVGDPREVADAVLVHRPAVRGEPVGDLPVVRVAAAPPRRVVDPLRDDEVDVRHSGRS